MEDSHLVEKKKKKKKVIWWTSLLVGLRWQSTLLPHPSSPLPPSPLPPLPPILIQHSHICFQWNYDVLSGYYQNTIFIKHDLLWKFRFCDIVNCSPFSSRPKGVRGLVTNYGEGGGYKNYVKFYPYEKGRGGGGVLAMLKGGTKSFGVVFTQKLEVLAILKLKKFPLFKRGGAKSFTVLRGGAKSFGPANFPFCSPPPLPVINDQSLRSWHVHRVYPRTFLTFLCGELE